MESNEAKEIEEEMKRRIHDWREISDDLVASGDTYAAISLVQSVIRYLHTTDLSDRVLRSAIALSHLSRLYASIRPVFLVDDIAPKASKSQVSSSVGDAKIVEDDRPSPSSDSVDEASVQTGNLDHSRGSAKRAQSYIGSWDDDDEDWETRTDLLPCDFVRRKREQQYLAEGKETKFRTTRQYGRGKFAWTKRESCSDKLSDSSTIINDTNSKDASQVLEAENAPQVLKGEDTSQVLEAENAPQVLEAENAPQVLEAENAPQVLEAENAPQVLEAENAPQVLEAETAPQVLEAENAPQVLEGEDAPQVLQGEDAPQVLQAEDAPQVLKHYSTQHVLVLADLPPTTRTIELERLLGRCMNSGVLLRWVNESVVVVVFQTPSAALEALNRIRSPFTARILDENDTLLSSISPSDLEPAKLRPKTDVRIARRLIAQGLGLRFPDFPTAFAMKGLRKLEEGTTS
ncbi:coiled-coil domain-containing protein R3HCC1L-like isoform X4 [Cucurbita moschata]|uniref:Coiled-coil domain-containing protein R3HCC1L-like isoform X4 n=1 Tax=Cucurbita moschata TaxID=3662 RepID=A0A6J1EDZ1_CUCMO|nr:coiled-coil domain-containing protein R3HCC1L-like isoform X4 [Cucurbita moschata]